MIPVRREELVGFKSSFRTSFYWAAALGLLAASLAPAAYAQSRMSDKDVASLMGNLKDDAKSFRPKFAAAVHKSSIRKTSREKDAKDLAVRFEKETGGMLNQFKKNRKADTELRVVMSTAYQIDQLVTSLQLGPQVSASWNKIQTELRQVENAFGIQPATTASVAPIAAQGGPSCYQAVGSDRANRLVDECLKVSPSTHPVCNVQNQCAVIIDEIRRGCRMLKQDAPMFCNEYMN
jgi:hypothetical protein